jgi:glycosyltransferase involved in cell wall biosynthesis
MKIAHVTPFFHPHVGGVESFVGSLVQGLCKKGHEVTVITSRHGRIPADDTYHGARVARLDPLVEIINTPVVPLLSREIVKGGFDVVHTHTPPPITEFYAAQGSKHGCLPLVISYHGDPEPQVRFGSLISSIYQRSFGMVALRHAKKIIVHTRTYAATSRAIWKFDPVIIPSAVDIDRFNPAIEPHPAVSGLTRDGKKVVLFVGRLVQQKGIEYFIRCAKHTGEDTVHLIVGSGGLEPELRALVKSLGLEKKVLFAGKVSDDDLPRYYAACDLFVLPSVSRLEGFGLVTLEAMSSGKPVLVSDIPGVREVIAPGSEGLLIEPMDPDNIAQKINMVLGDGEMMKRLGRNSRKKAETKYSWESVIKKIEDVYVEVTGKD